MSIGVLELLADTLYDRETISGQTLALFKTPLGGISAGYGRAPRLKVLSDTNLSLFGVLPEPDKFSVKSIRCAFFEPGGKPIPIHDAIYWEATVEFSISGRLYWRSPAAHVADPGVVLFNTDWSKIPDAERIKLIECLSCSLSIDAKSDGGPIIEQEQLFSVRIGLETPNLFDRYKGYDAMVALTGLHARAVV